MTKADVSGRGVGAALLCCERFGVAIWGPDEEKVNE